MHQPASTLHDGAPAGTAPVAQSDLQAAAADPSTAPATLAALANREDPRIRAALARNPNTPEPVLMRLWTGEPLALLENPLLEYRLLMNGEPLCSWLPLQVQVALYGALIESDPAGIESVLPLERRKEWVFPLVNMYSSRGASHSRKPQRNQNSRNRKFCERAFASMAREPDAMLRRSFALQIPEPCLAAFAHDLCDKVRGALVSRLMRWGYAHRDQFDRVCDLLAVDPCDQIRWQLASVSRLTPAAFHRLAQDPHPRVRQNLADSLQTHPNIDVGSWILLAASGTRAAEHVAANTSAPECVRTRLASHRRGRVRRAALAHLPVAIVAQTPEFCAIWKRLLAAQPGRAAEMKAIAGNRSMPRILVREMLDAVHDPEISRIAALNPNLLDTDRIALLQSPDPQTQLAAADPVLMQPHSRVVAAACAHANPAVRTIAAWIPGSPGSIARKKLVKDPDPEVRKAVYRYLRSERIRVRSGSGITSLLAHLANDPLPEIRALAAADPRLHDDVLQQLASDPSPEVRLVVFETQAERAPVKRALAEEPDGRVRAAAAWFVMDHQQWSRQPGTPGALIRPDMTIARDPSPLVRSTVADHSNASPEALGMLVEDDDPSVLDALCERNFPVGRGAFHRWLRTLPFHRQRSLNATAASANPFKRAVAARYSLSGKRRRAQLAQDPCWYVRLMVAMNPLCCEAILAGMLADPHPRVRSCAASRIGALAEEREFKPASAAR